MIAHVRAGGSAGNSNGTSERDAFRAAVHCSIRARSGTVPWVHRRRAGVQRSDGEALCLALLPTKFFARDQVERDIYNRHQLALKFFVHPKIAHFDIVVLIEAGKRIRFPIRIGSA